jgi:hypothetical protein
MSTEDIDEISVFDRYINPFDEKDGIDLKSDFKPDPHYLQLKSLCDEAFSEFTPSLHSFITYRKSTLS